MARHGFDKLMIERGNLVKITPEWKGKNRIPKGALIGYIGLPGTYAGLITAAYPFWQEVNNQVQFFIAMPGDCTWTDKAGVDNGYFTEDNLYINEDPIIIDVSAAEKSLYSK